MDQTYLGGVERGMVGRHTKTKTIVVIAAEVAGAGRADSDVSGPRRFSPQP